MTSEQPVHVAVTLLPQGELLSGEIVVQDHQPVAFTGWLQLMSVLERAVGSTDE